MSFNNSDYIDVATRIGMFREKHPEGSLQPTDLSKPYDIVMVGDKTFIVVVASAFRSPTDERPGIGMAWEPFPAMNQQMRGSELMLCETSAWGRAIVAALAADTKRGIASHDEVVARSNMEAVSNAFPNSTVVKESRSTTNYPAKTYASSSSSGGGSAGGASAKQQNFVKKLLQDNKVADPMAFISGLLDRNVDALTELSGRDASKVIEGLLNPSAMVPTLQPSGATKVAESPQIYNDEEPF
jgi:hypothetical protein